MHIGVFIPQQPRDHVESLWEFYTGAKNLTIADRADAYDLHQGYRQCDVAVVFGHYKHKVPASFPRGEIIRQHKGPIVFLEKGFVNRDEYFSVGLNGINGRANFCNDNSPSDRWGKLGVKLEPWKCSGDYILVCGQIPWDANTQYSNHVKWCQDIVSQLIDWGYSVKFRPHPKVSADLYGIINNPIDKYLSTECSLEHDLYNAGWMVAYNSNSLVEGIIAGVTCYAGDPEGSVAGPMCSSELNPTRIYTPPREQWVYNLAYSQWNLDELQTGEPWQRLRKAAQECLESS